jgi:hypothetical protein
VKKSIMHSVGGKAPATLQESISDMAVKKVLARTKGQYRGEERLKLIELVYIKRRYNVPGAAVQLHISEGTARDWNREFVYAVAKEMGFL